ncbi:MAG: SDR family NAD(P)-dependent oxidoreductase [Actinomycetota bacterium]
MGDFRGKVVVITGAANGIGREMARSFARRGARLVMVDIDGQNLRAAAGELEGAGAEATACVVDVSSAEEVADLCDDVYAALGRVDVLCNNAGVAAAGDFEAMSLDDLGWVIDVNLRGVIHGCHYFYPRMIAQGGGGHIVNTASSGGLAPFMALAVYCCTKYGVVGLSETLRAEAALHGIGVSAICPAAIATDIVLRGRIRSHSTRSTPEKLAAVTNAMIKRRAIAPGRVAEAAVKAVERDRGVVVVGPEAYLMDWTHRLSRRMFDFAMTGAVRAVKRLI